MVFVPWLPCLLPLAPSAAAMTFAPPLRCQLLLLMPSAAAAFLPSCPGLWKWRRMPKPDVEVAAWVLQLVWVLPLLWILLTVWLLPAVALARAAVNVALAGATWSATNLRHGRYQGQK
jgi:hypothetical protein